MGLIREPDGVDFVISGGPLTREATAEITEWIRKDRAAKAKAKELLRKVESRVLALPRDERAELVCTILCSLADDDLNDFTRDALASAINRFFEAPSKKPSKRSSKSPPTPRPNNSKRSSPRRESNVRARKPSPAKT